MGCEHEGHTLSILLTTEELRRVSWACPHEWDSRWLPNPELFGTGVLGNSNNGDGEVCTSVFIPIAF